MEKIDEPATRRTGQILSEEQEVIDRINTYRQANGLAPLKLNPLLCEISRGHSANMARLNRFGHYLEGRGPDQRCAAGGYYGYSGENVASGSPDTPQRFFQLWVNSSGHRRNMLGNHNEVGVGFAVSSSGSHYYTAVFGVGSAE